MPHTHPDPLGGRLYSKAPACTTHGSAASARTTAEASWCGCNLALYPTGALPPVQRALQCGCTCTTMRSPHQYRRQTHGH